MTLFFVEDSIQKQAVFTALRSSNSYKAIRGLVTAILNHTDTNNSESALQWRLHTVMSLVQNSSAVDKKMKSDIDEFVSSVDIIHPDGYDFLLGYIIQTLANKTSSSELLARADTKHVHIDALNDMLISSSLFIIVTIFVYIMTWTRMVYGRQLVLAARFPAALGYLSLPLLSVKLFISIYILCVKISVQKSYIY